MTPRFVASIALLFLRVSALVLEAQHDNDPQSDRVVVPRATFAEVPDYVPGSGFHPTGTRMFVYVPSNLTATPPAIVVGIHWCHATAQMYQQGTAWAPLLAERHGFIVLYPQSAYSDAGGDGCWDVSSHMVLSRGGGGPSDAIVDMVEYLVQRFGADRGRVYVTGISSGAMLTNVLAATYPDRFSAAIVYAGVPAGCFSSLSNLPHYWNATCANGMSIASQEYWAVTALDMYPGYPRGLPRPRMQVYHGTADKMLNVQNYYETIKQWTGVFGYGLDPIQTAAESPRKPYTKYVFGEMLETFLGTNVNHIDVFPDEDVKWFGFTQ